MRRTGPMLAVVYAAAALLPVSVAAQSIPDRELIWSVASQFPQYRDFVDGEYRWRTPPGALPQSGERDSDWYKRLALQNRSPYATFVGSPYDAWSETEQQYRAEFLQYIRGDAINVRIQLKQVPVNTSYCDWRVDGKLVGRTDGCSAFEVPISRVGALVEALPAGVTGPAWSARVLPRRRIILGLGDSYASGEGNPDIPTEWHDKALDGTDAFSWLKASFNRPGSYVRSSAEWRDSVCHRSFWNQQAMAAARVAAVRKDTETVFLHYACSGAEVFDGLLVAQVNPPGIGLVEKNGCSNPRHARCRVQRSQLSAAVNALCKGRLNSADVVAASIRSAVAQERDRTRLAKMEAFDKAPKGSDGGRQVDALDIVHCDDLVKPDAVLLSIGGNDIGFAQLVAWALMPRDGSTRALDVPYRILRKAIVVCPAPGRWCRNTTAEVLTDQLEFRFAQLASAMQSVGLAGDMPVLTTSYPDAIRLAPGTPDPTTPLCGDDQTARLGDDNDRNNQWTAFNVSMPGMLRAQRPWFFSLDARPAPTIEGPASPAHVLTGSALPKLRRQIKDSAQQARFTYVDTSDAFVGRGWCGETQIRATQLPLPKKIELETGRITGHTPAGWLSFSPRNRLIRTANDSYYTQLSIRSGDVNGTMHPTAEGHMVLAGVIYGPLARMLGEALAVSESAP